MLLTEIERFLFNGRNLAHFVTNFDFTGDTIHVRLRPIGQEESPGLLATFSAATMESLEGDPKMKDAWPLGIIGFDSGKIGERWRFLLNCGAIEWCWNSEWPSIEEQA